MNLISSINNKTKPLVSTGIIPGNIFELAHFAKHPGLPGAVPQR
jgi:hypothetical protein